MSRPYFESVVVFEVDEGLPEPVNHLNVSIDLVDDGNVEHGEVLIVTVEPRTPCLVHHLESQPQSLLFSRQSTFVHILDDDSKLFLYATCTHYVCMSVTNRASA